MHFHIITLFPEAFSSFLSTSIIGKAKEKGFFEVTFHSLKSDSDTFEKVDDKAYGMHGQVMRVDVIGRKIESVFESVGKKIPVIYFSPRGDTFTQKIAEKYISNSTELVLICGHYEGIDERIIELYVDQVYSIGEYVLSGGELPAQVFMDTLIRHIPHVLGNSQSFLEESFSQKFTGKKEHPLYTRPEDFRNHKVPSVLLSGNHKKIEEWKIQNLI